MQEKEYTWFIEKEGETNIETDTSRTDTEKLIFKVKQEAAKRQANNTET